MVKFKQIAIEQLKHDEGIRLFPYQCSADKLTIGYGRNLEDNGISEYEAEQMLLADTQVAAEDAKKFVGNDTWVKLSDVRKACLVNMAFNLGLPTLKTFQMLKTALQTGDMTEASAQMLDSKWASQVGQRAHRLAALMLEG
jgi:lysozyme